VGDVCRYRLRGDVAFDAEVARKVVHGGEDNLLTELVLRKVVR